MEKIFLKPRIKPFDHGFNETNLMGKIEPDPQEMLGYTKALGHIVAHLKEATMMQPDHVMISALDLLERITVTNEQILPLMQQVGERLLANVNEMR